MMEEFELHLILTGFVQNIGFRATVLNHAKNYPIVGEVKNLPDGSVEIIAQGQKRDLEKFLTAIQDYPGKAKVAHIKKEFRDKNGSFSVFDIGYA